MKQWILIIIARIFQYFAPIIVVPAQVVVYALNAIQLIFWLQLIILALIIVQLEHFQMLLQILISALLAHHHAKRVKLMLPTV